MAVPLGHLSVQFDPARAMPLPTLLSGNKGYGVASHALGWAFSSLWWVPAGSSVDLSVQFAPTSRIRGFIFTVLFNLGIFGV